MPSKNNKPIFYDPQYSRWRKFKRLLGLGVGLLSAIFIVVILSILINPILPNLKLPLQAILPQLQQPLASGLQPWKFDRKELVFQLAKNRLNKTLAQKPTNQSLAANFSRNGRFIGFYVNWDDNSFTSFKENIGKLDELIPEWLHLKAVDGSITLDEPAKQSKVMSYIKHHKPKLTVLPLINNFSDHTQDWNSSTLAQMLVNSAARQRNIRTILDYVHRNHFGGICLDYESIPTKSQRDYEQFIKELYQTFHPWGLKLYLSVPFDDPDFNYKLLAEYSDSLILMAYDEHWDSSTAGPVASQSWYNRNLKQRFSELPAPKVIVALGNYGYDWLDSSVKGAEASFQDAMRIGKETNREILFDSQSLNPRLDYFDQHHKLHHLWYLDAIVSYNEMKEAESYHPGGYALWRLGSEDPSIWAIFHRSKVLSRVAIRSLQTLQYGYDLNYEGEGEILKVADTPRNGWRNLSYDPNSGYINGQDLIAYPSAYTIDRWGKSNQKKVALTFDDGPDPTYTPEILDILHRYHVPATFFVVGMNGDMNTNLLQREVTEGHEIGNHTFTHPNIATISPRQLDLEINTTERLFESRLGRESVLFRPPYAEDIEPATPNEVKPLVLTSKLGYYTVGLNVDPSDWSRPGINKIIHSTLAQVTSGVGNVVLLHDGGGNRRQTVGALPGIIKELRAKGYQFVAISDLLGLKRNQVMPVVSKNELAVATIDEAGFLFIGLLLHVLSWLFFIGCSLAIIKLLMVGILAIRQRLQTGRRKFDPEFIPTVSVIIPAHNEEKVICKTIKSILQSDYPEFEIIMVDDGSEDQTYQKAREQFQTNRRIRFYRRKNSGKAESLNFGISQSLAEIVVALDADTVFQKDTISKLVRHFYDKQVGAVAGNAKVGNRVNLLTNFQALEYITSQNLDRRAFDTLNCITVVPGAIGAWRRELILKAGGFVGQTLAEDTDLTLTILRMGYRINYEDLAIALTEAPDNVRGFVKQRFRWMFGTMQAAWKHRDTLFKPRYKALGALAIPNLFIFQIIFPIISPIMDLYMVISLAWYIWQQHFHPVVNPVAGLVHTLFYYALFLLVDYATSLLAFLLEKRDDWSLLTWLLVQRFVYRQLMYYIAVKSLMTAIRGRMVGWGKVERKATVNDSQSLSA